MSSVIEQAAVSNCCLMFSWFSQTCWMTKILKLNKKTKLSLSYKWMFGNSILILIENVRNCLPKKNILQQLFLYTLKTWFGSTKNATFLHQSFNWVWGTWFVALTKFVKNFNILSGGGGCGTNSSFIYSSSNWQLVWHAKYTGPHLAFKFTG